MSNEFGTEASEGGAARSAEEKAVEEGSEALAGAISSLVGGVIGDFDRSAEATMKSQNELSCSLDRLTRELDKLLEDAPVPFIMQQATKISGVRNRVSSLNLVLTSIQRRLDNIDRMLAAGSSHEKMKAETSG